MLRTILEEYLLKKSKTRILKYLSPKLRISIILLRILISGTFIFRETLSMTAYVKKKVLGFVSKGDPVFDKTNAFHAIQNI